MDRMNTVRVIASALVAGSLTSMVGMHDAAAQREQTCAQVLSANPNYSRFMSAFNRVGATNTLNQDQPMTILAFDNNAVVQMPARIRNAFIPSSPEEGTRPGASMVVDHLILDGLHRSGELKPGFTMYTANDAAVQVVGMREGKPVLRAGGYDVMIVAPDQACRNGIIHSVTVIPRGQ
jgi:uncharacterized surface protein with fasciclin (FAS1) repeats